MICQAVEMPQQITGVEERFSFFRSWQSNICDSDEGTKCAIGTQKFVELGVFEP